jgi:DNA-binding IclR family transcriptional regulator
MRGTGDGTVGKALDVLDHVAGFARPVRFAELLATSTYPKATLYRMLQTLTSTGLLSYDEDRHTYAPGVRLVRLAHAAWAQSSLAPIARPHLDLLSRDIGETVHLAQLDAGQVLYVDKRNAVRPVEMFSEAGKVGPAYCTGVGKAMLAYLPEDQLADALSRQSFHRHTAQTLDTPEALRAELAAIRQRGHAYDREEHEDGIICIAVPILSPSGRLLGAMSVTGTTRHISMPKLESYLPRLRDAAKAIASDAADWRFPDTPSPARGAARAASH